MKKYTIFLLIFALLLCGCGNRETGVVSAAEEDIPLTFGNAVMTDTPEAAVLATADSATGENIVGYIWRLKDYSMNYDSSLLRNLQSDNEGGFWVLNSTETANGLGFAALHCDETGSVLSETTIPFIAGEDNGGCEMIAYGQDAVYYDYIEFLTRGGGDRPAETERYIRGCDLEGNELFSLLLTDLTDEDNPYISDIAAKDNYCLISTEFFVFALDKTGKVLWQVESEDSIDNMFVNRNGKVYIKTIFIGNALYELNTETHTFGEPIYELADGEYPQPGILGYDLLLCNNATNSPKVYGLILSSGEKTALWDCGAMGMLHAGNIIETGTGKLILDYASLMSGWCVGQLTQEPVYEGQEITPLTLGTVGSLSVTADTAVAMFNSLYPEYYLQVATYSDAEAMNLAILSGEAPDIICMDGLSEEDYARNDRLLNLSDYLNTDGIQLVPEYLAEYETTGGLYRLSPVFSYGYLDTASGLVPEDADTFEEYLTAAKANPDTPTWEVSADSVIWIMLGYSMTNFVDFDTGTCDFQSEEFIALLELAKMGRMLTEDEYLDAEWLYSPGSVGIWEDPVGKGGFPDTGVLVTNAMDTFGIYAGTAHPDAAWNFLSLLLSEDIQRSYSEMTGSCPVLQTLYEELVPEEIQTRISEARGHWVDTSDIYSVVSEEAAAYFAGDISPEVAAEHIQNRVMIYLGEQN